ncbi:MAG: hypothetical protein IPM29_10270 [Planctomycetes bacterium]|nr:hypothetical protein [Planctomycetota bacterium]
MAGRALARAALGCGLAACLAPASAQMAWQRANPAHTPPGRWNHAIVRDAARDLIVLFGGQSWSGRLADTWEWDGTDWLQRSPAVSPSPRSGHALAWFPGTPGALLFGGADGTTVFGDTWSWDGARWQQLQPARAPAPREGMGMVADPVRGVVVAFGGRDAIGGLLRDTWLWNGSDWRLVVPATLPPATWYPAMAFDERRGVAVMFSSPGPDVWEWNGLDWRARVATPPSLATGSFAYDRLRERCIMWSGVTYPLAITWEWDGDRWIGWSALPQPTRRDSQALAWDERRGGIMLFAGWHFHSASVFDDTWHWVPTTRGAVARRGTGCAGSAGIPALDAVGAPILGDLHFTLAISGARPSANTVVLLSAQAASDPLPGGCTLLVAPPWIALPGTTDPTGHFAARAPVPIDVALRRATVEVQGIVEDPAGACLGVAAMTAGLTLTIGD